MKETISRLEQLLKIGMDYITQATEPELSSKPNPDKWSKKEILGHLIDSGINNLQRFTEIQFAKLPYKIRKYNQDALVKANNYQEANLKEITAFWLAVNNRIMFVMQNQTETSLSYQIELSENEYADLRFLMEDYVDHLEHHLNQIIKNSDHEL